MYVLRSKKHPDVIMGWSDRLWATGGFELVDEPEMGETPAKVMGRIAAATGLNLATSAAQPAVDPLSQPEPAGVVTPVPETTVTDANDPATVPTSLFAGDDASDAEDDT